jgi:hypothetical protein
LNKTFCPLLKFYVNFETYFWVTALWYTQIIRICHLPTLPLPESFAGDWL